MERESRALFDLQRFIALDVEAGAGVSSANVQTVRHRGQVPWVYVSPGGWTDIMGHSTSFSHLPLWVAGYPRRFNRMHWNVPAAQHPHSLVPATVAVGQEHYLPFGGWIHAAGWQFDGTTPYRGETLDLNVFIDGVFGAEDSVEEEDDMKAHVAYSAEGNNAVWLAYYGEHPHIRHITSVREQQAIIDEGLVSEVHEVSPDEMARILRGFGIQA